jgi:hypothetical protein
LIRHRILHVLGCGSHFERNGGDEASRRPVIVLANQRAKGHDLPPKTQEIYNDRAVRLSKIVCEILSDFATAPNVIVVIINNKIISKINMLVCCLPVCVVLLDTSGFRLRGEIAGGDSQIDKIANLF